MQDVEDEPLFTERAAGLDIAKAEVEVTIRVPSDTGTGRRQQETRTFRTTRSELLALADWLRCWGVTKIGMEGTLVIRGNEDQRRCCRRSGSHVRVSDGKGKSGIDERPQRDELCGRLSASRTVLQITRP